MSPYSALPLDHEVARGSQVRDHRHLQPIRGRLVDRRARISRAVAEKLLVDTIAKHGIDRDQLIVHADNGSSIAAKPVAFLLTDLGVTKTHSRPVKERLARICGSTASSLLQLPAISSCHGSWRT